MFNRKSAIATVLLALGTVAAGSAHASNVQWSVGINLPPVGTVISSGPVYSVPAPVYVEPAPVVVYRPAPPPPPPVVVYRPVPVYAPVPVYGPGVVRAGWVRPWHHHHHNEWRDGRRRPGYEDGDRTPRWVPEPRRHHH